MKQLEIERADLPSLVNKGSDLVGIELGVATGDFSAKLWKGGRFQELWGVDAYGDHHDTGEYLNALRLVGLDANYRLLRMFFDDALELFPDNYFDFVYIDGYAHTGENAGKTLYDWFPKVKVGGLIGGHDYHEDWPLVVQSVDRFAKDAGMEPMLTQLTSDPGPQDLFPSWACIKQDDRDLVYPDALKSLALPVKKKKKPEKQISARAGIVASRLPSKFIRQRKAKVQDALPADVTQRIGELQGTKTGKRCLIVGSAPSVSELDLSKVRDCDVFALNSAQQLCQELAADETFLTVADPRAFEGDLSSVPLEKFDKVLLSANAPETNAAHAYRFEYYAKPQVYKGFAQSDLGQPLYHCHTVAGFALQIAVGMGYSEVYLAGIDLNFSNADVHFYKSTTREREWVRRVSSPKESKMRAGLAYLSHWAKKNGVRVTNLSPVSNLPLIDHGNFDQVFPTR